MIVLGINPGNLKDMVKLNSGTSLPDLQACVQQ